MTFFVKGLICDGGYTRNQASHLFMVMGWASLPCDLIWGGISDVIGRRRALMISYLNHAIAYTLFACCHTVAGFATSAILFGLSAWSVPAIMAATCGDVLGSRMAPAALGFVTLFFGIGQALGPVVAGFMADVTGSFASAFLLAAGVASAGALGAGLLRPDGSVVQGEGSYGRQA